MDPAHKSFRYAFINQVRVNKATNVEVQAS